MQDIKTQNQTIVSDEVKHLELSFFVQYTAYTLLQDPKSEQEKKVYISTGKKSNTTYYHGPPLSFFQQLNCYKSKLNVISWLIFK